MIRANMLSFPLSSREAQLYMRSSGLAQLLPELLNPTCQDMVLVLLHLLKLFISREPKVPSEITVQHYVNNKNMRKQTNVRTWILTSTHSCDYGNKDSSYGSAAGEHVAPCSLIAGERMFYSSCCWLASKNALGTPPSGEIQNCSANKIGKM